MCYNSVITKTKSSNSSLKCFQCNSELILVKTWEETPEGGMFPQTITIYRCTNDECQAEKDKQEKKRKEAVKEKEMRMEAIAKVKAERKIIATKEKAKEMRVIAKNKSLKNKREILVS